MRATGSSAGCVDGAVAVDGAGSGASPAAGVLPGPSAGRPAGSAGCAWPNPRVAAPATHPHSRMIAAQRLLLVSNTGVLRVRSVDYSFFASPPAAGCAAGFASGFEAGFAA